MKRFFSILFLSMLSISLWAMDEQMSTSSDGFSLTKWVRGVKESVLLYLNRISPQDIELYGLSSVKINQWDLVGLGRKTVVTKDAKNTVYLSNIDENELSEKVIYKDQLTDLSTIPALFLYIEDDMVTKSLDFSHLTNVVGLDLSINNRVDLPDCLTSLIGLEYLNLESNNISVMQNFLTFTALQTLVLRDNSLGTLPLELKELTSLTKLDLSQNALISCASLGDLINLEDLNISKNQIQILSEGLSKLTNLTTIDLNGNSVSDITVLVLPQLQHLIAEENQIKNLPDGLKGSTTLAALFLANNPIEAIENLPQLPALTELSVTKPVNTVDSQFLQLIVMCTSLTDLAIAGTTFKVLPKELKNLSRLQKLRMNLEVDNTDVEEFLEELGELKEFENGHDESEQAKLIALRFKVKKSSLPDVLDRKKKSDDDAKRNSMWH